MAFHDTYLQCTTIGPLPYWSSYDRTLRRNAIIGLALKGTPWSGHDIKWNCLTVRVSSSYKSFKQQLIFQNMELVEGMVIPEKAKKKTPNYYKYIHA